MVDGAGIVSFTMRRRRESQESLVSQRKSSTDSYNSLSTSSSSSLSTAGITSPLSRAQSSELMGVNVQTESTPKNNNDHDRSLSHDSTGFLGLLSFYTNNDKHDGNNVDSNNHDKKFDKSNN